MLATITKEILDPITYEQRRDRNGNFVVCAVQKDYRTGKVKQVVPVSDPMNEEYSRIATEEANKTVAPTPAPRKRNFNPLSTPGKRTMIAWQTAMDPMRAAHFFEWVYQYNIVRYLLAFLTDQARDTFAEMSQVKQIENRLKKAEAAADDLLDSTYLFKVGSDNDYNEAQSTARRILRLINHIVGFNQNSGGDTGLLKALEDVATNYMSDDVRAQIRIQHALGVQEVIKKGFTE